jgi:hypothetical protein
VDAPSRIYQQLTPTQRAVLEQRVTGLQSLTQHWLTDLGIAPVNAEKTCEPGCSETHGKPRSEPRR